MNTTNTLKEKINNAKALDFGIIFNDSIELFKKTWLQGFLLLLFTLIIMLPFIIIIYIPLIPIIITQVNSGYTDSNIYGEFFAGMSIIYILFVIVGYFVLIAVSLALNAAFYRIIKRIDHGKQVTSSDFFYFLKIKYLSKTFMLSIVSVLIALLSTLLCFIPIIYVIVPMSFFVIVFAFNPDLSVNDIVNISFKIGHKKWLLAFGLIIVSGILAEIVGILLCGIGLLFTAAFVYHPLYLIYKNVIGFENEDTIEEVNS